MMTTPGPAPYLRQGERVVIYDGVCRLCNGWVNFLIRHDKNHSVRLVAVQSEAGEALLKWAGLSPQNVNTLVLIDGENLYKRSEAIFRVMSFLPWPWRMLTALRRLPLPLRDACYNRIALNRYRLWGRYDSVKSCSPIIRGDLSRMTREGMMTTESSVVIGSLVMEFVL